MNTKTIILLSLAVFGSIVYFRNLDNKIADQLSAIEVARQVEAEQRRYNDSIEEARRLEAARMEEIRSTHEARARYVAENAGNLIIREKYDDGINKFTQMVYWEYYSGSEYGKPYYKIDVEMTWNGQFVHSNYYAAKGVIIINTDGTNLQWKPTYINPTLAQYLDDINQAVFGGLLIGAGIAALSE